MERLDEFASDPFGTVNIFVERHANHEAMSIEDIYEVLKALQARGVYHPYDRRDMYMPPPKVKPGDAFAVSRGQKSRFGRESRGGFCYENDDGEFAAMTQPRNNVVRDSSTVVLKTPTVLIKVGDDRMEYSVFTPKWNASRMECRAYKLITTHDFDACAPELLLYCSIDTYNKNSPPGSELGGGSRGGSGGNQRPRQGSAQRAASPELGGNGTGDDSRSATKSDGSSSDEDTSSSSDEDPPQGTEAERVVGDVGASPELLPAVAALAKRVNDVMKDVKDEEIVTSIAEKRAAAEAKKEQVRSLEKEIASMEEDIVSLTAKRRKIIKDVRDKITAALDTAEGELFKSLGF